MKDSAASIYYNRNSKTAAGCCMEGKAMKKLRVGVIGIGDISNVYLNNLKKYDAVEVVACASRGLEKAQRKAS